MTTRKVNSPIDEYLVRLRAALEGVWPPRRDQILADIEEHIAAALEELDDPTDAAVEQMLAQIGDPSEIAAAALSLEPPSHVPPAGPPKLGAHEMAGVALLSAGVVVPALGWIIGVILLWTSRVWTVRDKLIGTFLVPGGLLPAAYWLFLRPANTATSTTCAAATLSGASQSLATAPCASGSGGSVSNPSGVGWLVLTVVFIVIPVLTAVYLLSVPRIRARRTLAGKAARWPRSHSGRVAITIAPIVLAVLVAVSIVTNSWPYTNIKNAVLDVSPDYVQLYPVQTTASSFVPADPPGNIDDGDTTTFWATKGPIGQTVTLSYAGTQSFQAVSLINGDQFPPSSFTKFARPKQVELIFSSGGPVVFTLPDSPAFYNHRFSARSSSFLELRILSVYPGQAPCAITELDGYTQTG